MSKQPKTLVEDQPSSPPVAATEAIGPYTFAVTPTEDDTHADVQILRDGTPVSVAHDSTLAPFAIYFDGTTANSLAVPILDQIRNAVKEALN